MLGSGYEIQCIACPLRIATAAGLSPTATMDILSCSSDLLAISTYESGGHCLAHASLASLTVYASHSTAYSRHGFFKAHTLTG